MNPYDDLGVRKDATDAEIRRAYKRRAGETHPDKGGDCEEFKRVNAAHHLLTDRTRRAEFDKSGRVDGAFQDVRAIMLEEVAAYVLGVIDAPNIQLEYNDVVGRVRNILEGEILALEVRRAELQKKIAKRERGAKRIRRIKGGDNLIATMILAECDRLREALSSLAAGMKHKRELVELVLEYAYDVGPERPTSFQPDLLSNWIDLLK